MGRLTATAVLVAAAVVSVPSAAHADEPDAPSLDEVTDEELARSVSDIDLRVGDIDTAASVLALETETTSGDTTVVALSSDVLFAFGRAEVSDAAQDRVEELVAEVPDGARVSIDGHTDSIGSDRDNQVLSEERAEAVAAIVEKARPDLRLDVTGHGEKDPVASNGTPENDDPAGRAKNRRVEIRYEG